MPICMLNPVGEARIICRPLNVPAESGSRLTFDKWCACFEIRDSKSLPISVIDAGKALPQDVVDAGHEPPEEITAVVRPTSFSSVTASKSLDQKYTMKENFEMALEIKFKADENEKELRHIYSG